MGRIWLPAFGKALQCTHVSNANKQGSHFPDRIGHRYTFLRGFPGGSVVKNPPANATDEGSLPGWERSPGEGNGNPF